MSGPAHSLVTHGELMNLACRHLDAASLGLERDPLTSRLDAQNAMTAYREVVHALNGHARRVFGPEARVRTIREAARPYPEEALAVRLLDSLSRAVNVRRPVPDAVRETAVADHWLDAAKALRAATDLLSTHRAADGTWRTPDSAALDSRGVRKAGIREVAALIATAADAEPDLYRQVRVAGLRHHEVTRRLPDMGAVRDAALRLGRPAAADPGDVALLARTQVARPAIRVGDPVTDLADLLATLRLAAWQLAASERASITSLGKIAAIAIRWHATLELVGTSEPAPPPRFADALASGGSPGPGGQWRVARLQLRRLRTLGPASPAMDALTTTTWQRLVSLAPRGVHGSDLGAGDRQRLEAILLRGTEVFGEVADWNATTVQRLSNTGQLYVPARALTGDEVTDHPDLAAAKLAGRYVAARPEHLRPLLVAYAAASADVAPLRGQHSLVAATIARARPPAAGL